MLQANKDKMGSSEDDFTPLSELTVGMNKCRVRVRVSRLWESFNPKNDISFGLDCLLIDDQGETMQARVLPDDIDQFEGQLIEGKVYALSDFTVDDTRESYMTCSNEFTIYFGRQTVVNEIEGDIDSIPLHSFEFIDFKNLHSMCDDNSILTDVLGHIVYVGDLHENEKKSRIEICNATIQNLSGRKLGVTLYGDIACGFAEDMLEKGLKASVVAVFAGMRVESSHSVCSTTCSKYYLDLEIPEVQEFCENLSIQQENPVPEKSQAQKLAESWRTIEQLKRLNPKDYDEDTKFLCRVSLIDIDCTSGWCYLGCNTCYKSMYRAPRKYKCSRCGPIKRPINWYKLKTMVQDATGTMNLMIFCEVAEELVGVSAEELVDEIEDDEEWFTLPDEIEDLLGSTHTFQVFDKHLSGSFSVYAIMDDDTVPVPAAATSQCKEESVPEVSVNAAVPSPATTQCKAEPGMAAPAPAMIPCKEEPVLEENFSMVVPAPTTKHECKEEPFLEHSVNMAVLKPTITQCKEEEPVPKGSAGTGEARLKSTRLQKPNKRLRGDDWIN
ncbi:replication protein A 70 kDa DNA-binding subunit C-like isoform X2 [Miscanthus floridulus]|uniref:replication protein A 70 kDa DNA-binding subunit C-like isoform X2 n=1 Tax=Miscanthus floridulus TaxID=154761 RepID=UPI003459EC1A